MADVLTNLLGVATILMVTNTAPPTFELQTCPTCKRPLYYTVIENFTVVKSNVAPVLVGGRVQHLALAPSITNFISVHTTQHVEHPAVYKKPIQPMPLQLPPDPAAIYQENMQTNTAPRRSNVPVYVPPPAPLAPPHVAPPPGAIIVRG